MLKTNRNAAITTSRDDAANPHGGTEPVDLAKRAKRGAATFSYGPETRTATTTGPTGHAPDPATQLDAWIRNFAATGSALVVSISISKDGWDNTANAIRDLMDTRPTTFDNSEVDPVIAKVNAAVMDDPRVVGVQTRARDEGHVLHLEVFVQVDRLVVEVAWLEELERRCNEVDWRAGDVVVTVTTEPHPVADARLE